MKVRELMTPDVATVTPGTSLKEAAALLAERGISGVPVVDEAGTVVGVLSEADIVVRASGDPGRRGLLGWLLEPEPGREEKLHARTVGEAMSSPAITIDADRPVHEAASLMVAESVNRLPVVDDGKLVGILTRADIVRAFTRTDAEIEREIREDIIRRILWLEPGSVSVRVEGGAVVLEGTVESEADAELLPVFVARVPGVVAVQADLRPRERVAT
ncbi:MAG TPA: CBS domain-containing protein [Gaiellaceae bacterium]|nr:CBS domain-containing protein [Gaiellaceae bacterium]